MLNANDHYDYCGLDSGRDTEAEVETAIRSFPKVLPRRSRKGYRSLEPYIRRRALAHI